jgi:hypothetical protein
MLRVTAALILDVVRTDGVCAMVNNISWRVSLVMVAVWLKCPASTGARLMMEQLSSRCAMQKKGKIGMTESRVVHGF